MSASDNSSAPSPPPSDSAAAAAEIGLLRQQLNQANQMGNQVVAQLQAAEKRIAEMQAQGGAQEAAQRASRLKAPPLPTFHGEMGFAVDNWLRSVNKQFVFYGTSEFPDDLAKIRFAAAHLEGAALSWWESEPSKNSIDRWEAFVERLHERFRPMAAADVARERLLALRQKGSVSAYCNAFQRELTPIKDMSVSDQIFFFRQGLSKELANEVRKKDPKTLHEAMDIAVRAEIHTGRVGYGQYGAFFGQRGAGTTGSSAGAAAGQGTVPMDINSVELEDYPAMGSYEEFEEPTPTPRGATGDASVLAMMQEMRAEQQRLFAMFKGRERQPARTTSGMQVPDVTAEEVRACLQRSLCIKCKKPGHLARECTYRGPTVRLNC
jgi:restriction endonuclease Mrr